jgi:hypothetical protein
VTNPGYHVENKSIEVTIKNQFTNGYLFYNIRVRGHFEENWAELYTYTENSYSPGSMIRQSSSDNTVISLSLNWPPGAQVDFEVEAILGSDIQVFISDHPGLPPPYSEIGHYEQRTVFNITSGWSNTQTLTIPNVSPSPSITPTPTPTPTPTNAPTSTPVPTQTPTSKPSNILTASPGQPNVQGVSQADFYTAIFVLSAVIVALFVAVAFLARKVKAFGLEVKKQ